MDDFDIVLSPPKKQSSVEWVTPEADMYEAYVVGVEPVDNYFYGKEDSQGKVNKEKYKLDWTFQIDESQLPELTQDDLPDGVEERKYGAQIRFYKTGTKLGAHPRNGLVKTLKAVDPDFDLDVGYESFEQMKSKVLGRYVRVVTEDQFSKDGTKRYLKVAGLIKSSKGKVDTATLLALQTGGKTEYDNDPFA